MLQVRYEAESRGGQPSRAAMFEYAMQLTHAPEVMEIRHGILLFQSPSRCVALRAV